ncbi:unnamed protein product [Lupinus luteus]|uniref:Cytochrome P450 n=1 Tax=Lupinus luteus TaxID=3873 RepID=A0AAV1XQC3_LUPLU
MTCVMFYHFYKNISKTKQNSTFVIVLLTGGDKLFPSTSKYIILFFLYNTNNIFVYYFQLHELMCRFLPTKKNLERKRLAKKTSELIQVLTEDTHRAEKNSDNLLSLLISSHKYSNNEKQRLKLKEIIDECRNFYLAGKDTAANSLSWVLLLLGLNQEWQNKARREVLSVIGFDTPPTAETLSDLKLVSSLLPF